MPPVFPSRRAPSRGEARSVLSLRCIFAIPTAISPRQGDSDAVLFFVGVQDVEATLTRAEELGGRIVPPAQQVPGVTFGVLADAPGHLIGVAAN